MIDSMEITTGMTWDHDPDRKETGGDFNLLPLFKHYHPYPKRGKATMFKQYMIGGNDSSEIKT